MANIYVKFDTPEELAKQAEEALETAQSTGKVAKMLILLKSLHTFLY